MCGIFGYIGTRDPLRVCLEGLEQLEYRGYDSTGICGISNGKLSFCKKAGKLSVLKRDLKLESLEIAIGHTRWATHGSVTDANAHPHFDANDTIGIVHNGIIENYQELRHELQTKGNEFRSETDTEAIVQWIAENYQGNFLEAVQKTVPLLRGSYAFALIHRNHPGEIIAVAHNCPLAIGINPDRSETIISSDPNAFIGPSFQVLFLQDGEIASVKKGEVHVFFKGKLIQKRTEILQWEQKAPSKGSYPHFMLKEIHEQPQTVQKAFLGRINQGTREVEFEPFGFSHEELKKFKQVLFLGMGTSHHAGAIGALYLEEFAKIPSRAEVASEVRFRTPLLHPDTLIIAVSQSGETADTIAAMREAKKRGCKILAICNVPNSTMTREVDGCLYLNAGPEISVCSTKALTSQIAVLLLFALLMGQLKGMRHPKVVEELSKIPSLLQQILDESGHLEALAKKYAHFNDFFFMGRLYMHITCLEAALKLKEISYVNANGYPAGELKHGPIALLDRNFPVVAFCANHQTEEKTISNLMEVKARNAPVLAFAPRSMGQINRIVDDVAFLPECSDSIAPFPSAVAGQLFAYFIAKERGCDIDQPRNLAKSVTVE